MEDAVTEPAYLAVMNNTAEPDYLVIMNDWEKLDYVAVMDNARASKNAAAIDDAAHNPTYHDTIEDKSDSTAIDVCEVCF